MILWWISAPQCMGMLITNKALVVFLPLRTEVANKQLCLSLQFILVPSEVLVQFG